MVKVIDTKLAAMVYPATAMLPSLTLLCTIHGDQQVLIATIVEYSYAHFRADFRPLFSTKQQFSQFTFHSFFTDFQFFTLFKCSLCGFGLVSSGSREIGFIADTLKCNFRQEIPSKSKFEHQSRNNGGRPRRVC
uniref:Uncharacterized protein n=1 Tax=Cacopsylla melanoneura TaxID=428564 RepID=A0A8D8UFX4_9HEMI